MSNYKKEKYIAKKWDHDRSSFSPEVSGLSKVYLIADEIAKGSTYRDIAKRFSEEWNVSPNYIRSMVNEAIGLFQDENYYKSIKEINNERLNDIYKEARQKGDLDTAIKAVDKLNKSNGVYDQPKAQVNVQTEDSNITITFGGVPVDQIVTSPKPEDVPYTEVDKIIADLNKNEDEE